MAFWQMTNQESFTTSQVQAFLSRLATYPILLCGLIAVGSTVQGIRGGMTTNLVILLFGAILSAAGIFIFILAILLYGIPKKRSIAATLSALIGFAPWMFGSYLVFYKGFWSLNYLFSDFHLWGLAQSLMFIFVGFVIVQRFYRITEVERSISDGRIMIVA
jgi:membrane-bound ClpP family serine protease